MDGNIGIPDLLRTFCIKRRSMAAAGVPQRSLEGVVGGQCRGFGKA